MAFIPAFLINLVTFPGVIIHELGHILMLKIFKVGIKEFKLFQFNTGVWSSTGGYVIHEPPKTVYQSFFISFGPFFLNTSVAMLVFAGAWFISGIPYIILMWLGLSVAMHAFPSGVDAKSLWGHAMSEIKNKKYAAVIYLPFAAAAYVAHILSIIWFDLIYALGIMFIVFYFMNLGAATVNAVDFYSEAVYSPPIEGVNTVTYSNPEISVSLPNWEKYEMPYTPGIVSKVVVIDNLNGVWMSYFIEDLAPEKIDLYTENINSIVENYGVHGSLVVANKTTSDVSWTVYSYNVDSATFGTHSSVEAVTFCGERMHSFLISNDNDTDEHTTALEIIENSFECKV
jgi:hypothetical protein